MTKIGDKEDPLEHIQKHIDTAASRCATASVLIRQHIEGLPGVSLEDVENACKSVNEQTFDAMRHIWQQGPLK